MRIGVYFPGSLAQTGGGHTFEEQIYQSLIRSRKTGKNRHDFVAFCEKKPPIPGGIETVNLASFKRNGIRHTAARMGRQALGLITRSSQCRRRDPVERLLDHCGIEVMYYPTPQPLTLELPYFSTVWDLQHRLQPFFPEVSCKGQWDSREALYSRQLRRAAGIITGTRAGKAEIERFYQVAPERIKLLPHPTPDFALQPAEADFKASLARRGVRREYLLYPAQFWPHKNHVGLLRAVHLLREQHGMKLDVVFVGADWGNEKHVRRVVAELGLADAVHFLGFVERNELVALYRGALALTYVTFFGPENLPPLEAFALGCPVIASDVPGAEEQLGDSALRIQAAEERDIASAIKRLHDDSSLREELIRRGRRRAQAFTGDDFVSGLMSLFDEFAAVRHCWQSGLAA
jgi:glycosyltransferase involved in cell wall biosynthesis